MHDRVPARARRLAAPAAAGIARRDPSSRGATPSSRPGWSGRSLGRGEHAHEAYDAKLTRSAVDRLQINSLLVGRDGHLEVVEEARQTQEPEQRVPTARSTRRAQSTRTSRSRPRPARRPPPCAPGPHHRRPPSGPVGHPQGRRRAPRRSRCRSGWRLLHCPASTPGVRHRDLRPRHRGSVAAAPPRRRDPGSPGTGTSQRCEPVRSLDAPDRVDLHQPVARCSNARVTSTAGTGSRSAAATDSSSGQPAARIRRPVRSAA